MLGQAIITRTQPAADALAEKVAANGFEALLCPFLEAVPTHTACPPAKPDGLLLTSTQALRFLPDDFDRDLPVFAVGDATAEAARIKGFKDTTSARGDVAMLAQAVCATKPDGIWLHAGAETLSQGTEAMFAGLGLTVVLWPVYRTEAVREAPQKLYGQLCTGKADYILVQSMRTAHLIAEAIRLYDPMPDLSKIKVLCLSSAMIECFSPFNFCGVYAAHTPDEAALLNLLGTESRHGRPNAER